MKETYISTREVAGLLNVTETTIKRWTGSGRLKCVKTLGGHRKYLLSDIEAFAKENEIAITGVTTTLNNDRIEKLGYAVYSKNMSLVSDIILGAALKGDREEIFESLMYLVKNRIKFADIVDEIVRPAMEKVGYLWETKKLGIEQEHLASNTLKTALSTLFVYLPRQKKRNIKILLACTEGEYHDMGLQALAYELEINGYRIIYLGANTPFKSLIQAIITEKPNYIFISASAPSVSREAFIHGLKSLAKAANGINSKLVAGGRYFQSLGDENYGCSIIVNSIKESVSFINKSKIKTI